LIQEFIFNLFFKIGV